MLRVLRGPKPAVAEVFQVHRTVTKRLWSSHRSSPGKDSGSGAERLRYAPPLTGDQTNLVRGFADQAVGVLLENIGDIVARRQVLPASMNGIMEFLPVAHVTLVILFLSITRQKTCFSAVHILLIAAPLFFLVLIGTPDRHHNE